MTNGEMNDSVITSLKVFLKGKIEAEIWNGKKKKKKERKKTLWTKTKPDWNIMDKVCSKSFPTISATDIV